jgi:hypothetical protein
MSKRPAIAAGLLARPGSAPARSTAVEDLPRFAPPELAPPNAPAPAEPISDRTSPSEQGRAEGGIKAATRGLTVYLLPEEHKRLRQLALDVDAPSLHELLLRGLDRLLQEQGKPPIRRYEPSTKKADAKQG